MTPIRGARTAQKTHSPEPAKAPKSDSNPQSDSKPKASSVQSSSGSDSDREVRAPASTRTRTEARDRFRADLAAQQLRSKAEGEAAPSSEASAGGGPRRRFRVASPGGTDAESVAGSPLPAGTSAASVAREGDRIVVDAGSGSDQITVTPESGGVRVTVNGTDHDFTAAQAELLTIRAGAGNDRVEVDPTVTAALRIEGGDGDDTLIGGAGDEVLIGGDGGDYIEGGGGDDTLNGGEGRDVLYGLDGDDTLMGWGGRDYLDGGRGDDRLDGGDDIDQVFGGRGDDSLRGGDGDDLLAGGHGRDAFNGDGGADRIIREGDEWTASDAQDTRVELDMSAADPGTSVTVVGDARFQSRVESDLDTLRSTESGRALLQELDGTGRATTIETTTGGNAAGYTTAADRFMTSGNTVNGPGTDTQVEYNPSRIALAGSDPWSERPPIVGLYHELVHAADAGAGAMPTGETDGSRNRENIAVGLEIDHDGDPRTPRIQPNPNTENDFREELNLERRERY